jgi:hypothetical protein
MQEATGAAKRMIQASVPSKDGNDRNFWELKSHEPLTIFPPLPVDCSPGLETTCSWVLYAELAVGDAIV